jgi:hypothetical protein
MTVWDLRTFQRALGATLLGLVIVGLVTAASDEGQIALFVRVGRTLPLAPIAGAVGVALALGTPRVCSETRALEALGRSPAESMVSAVIGSALPSIAIAMFLFANGRIDIGAFFPRAAHGDVFVFHNGAFESASIGVRVGPDGQMQPLLAPAATGGADEDLPQGARGAAAATTVLAGLALPLLVARTAVHTSLLDPRARRRRRNISVAIAFLTALSTLVAFQAAAVKLAPALLAAIPSALLLAISLFVEMRSQRLKDIR